MEQLLNLDETFHELHQFFYLMITDFDKFQTDVVIYM